MRACEVLMQGVRAGLLTEDDAGRFTFVYDAAYLLGEGNLAVSLTLPLRSEPYHQDYLFPCFFNMLSEGENRQMQSQLLHIDADDDLGILLGTAQMDTIGAVTFKPISAS